MSIPIEMPKLSDTMTQGTLLRWCKKVGDKVVAGDILAEVETDKATMEMEAFDDGVLGAIHINDGEKAAVGQKIGLLLEEGETLEEATAAPAPAPAAGKAKPDTRTPTGANAAQSGARPEPETAAAPAAPVADGRRVKASPLARKIAAARGVDLSRIVGTGPGGRVVREDVLASQPSATLQAVPGSMPPPTAAPAAPAGPGDERVPLSGMRRVIADRLLLSKTTLPHFYLNIEVDAGPLMKLRAEINAAAEAAGQGKATVNDFVLKACVVALTRVPKVNAAWAGDAIIEYGAINLAVAVAVDDGLVTPVLRNAEKKSLREISAAVKDLATRARSKKLKPEEYQNGTFTVSNLGSYGVESFSAIINPPQAAILAVGAIVKKPVVNAAGEVVAGQRMALGLSCDHRVVDGAIGAEYLKELRQLIEKPTTLLF
ncbi:MAG TPA: pyruvate dehydrogenase complex dihydrolipoamide acetyltransferase [Chthoniobacteraceae bacterium]|nr:pyruvate dehydrogenase complex dihydrolipoamide acetyltransferase [Chthoniobacteraceae bacterium]